MKILLTGATGFIGGAFLRLALLRGHTVAALLRPGKEPPRLEAGKGRLVWVRGTLEAPPWRGIEVFQPECCVHTAWITTPGVYLEAPENHQFERWSLALARRLGELGMRHMLALGTCIEYQAGPAPLLEDQTPLASTTTYARCKVSLHAALQKACAKRGWSLCWGRVFYPYGPGEPPARLCSSIISQFAASRQVVLKTPTSTKDYIYIEDLADAMLTVVEQRAQGTINLGTGQGVTVREIAQTLAVLMNRPGLIEESDAPAADPLGFVVADASRLRGLGWQPKHDLGAGLKKMIAGGIPVGAD